MQTVFILMAQYQKAVIPIEQVARDYFSHLQPDKLARKILNGEINLPIVKLERSQKSARGIHVNDLAAYIDAQREQARKEQSLIT